MKISRNFNAFVAPQYAAKVIKEILRNIGCSARTEKAKQPVTSFVYESDTGAKEYYRILYTFRIEPLKFHIIIAELTRLEHDGFVDSYSPKTSPVLFCVASEIKEAYLHDELRCFRFLGSDKYPTINAVKLGAAIYAALSAVLIEAKADEVVEIRMEWWKGNAGLAPRPEPEKVCWVVKEGELCKWEKDIYAFINYARACSLYHNL